MNHKIKVGKPIIKDGAVVGHDEVTEIATNQVFNWNRRGFKAIPEDEVKTPTAEEKASGSDDEDDDLSQLTVKELRAIAEPLGVKGKTKADLVSAIELAHKETYGE